MHSDPLSFVNNGSGLKLYDQLIGNLMCHAGETLRASLAFAVLIDPVSGGCCHITEGFGQLPALSRESFIEFAQDVAKRGDRVAATVPRQTPEGQLVGSCLINIHGKAAGALIFLIGDDFDSSSLTDLLEIFSQFGSTILQKHEAGVALHRQHDQDRANAQKIEDLDYRWNALVATVPGAIFYYIRNPSGTEEIEFLSPGCNDIWEYSADELGGDPAPLWAMILPEDLQAVQTSIHFSQETSSRWQHRWRIRSRSGFLKWLQAYGTPHHLADGRVAWYTLILDVTVEQDAQNALAENTRLLHEAQKLESIGRLADGVAHDFNNLLAVIVGNAECIVKGPLSPDAKDAVTEIIEASQRGASLVKQLLSFARKSDLRATVSDVREVLHSVDTLLRRVLPASVSLEVAHRAGLWPVQIDRSMFESALLNIVINARDAMPTGGAITIETSNERVDNDYLVARDEDAKPGRYVMVAVTDTGVGIDETALPLVFEPFFSTKDHGEGTGLGLAMVQGFVKQSRGIVRVYSEQHRGTSIKMYFPAASDTFGTVSSFIETLPTQTSSRATVLLVEDQDGVRKVIEKTISVAGYKVVAAASGDEAFEIYQQMHETIDVIVTDVVMPGRIQGPQLVKLARKINHTVPALYMSGYPHEANVHGNGIRAGDISLLKPVRRTDLLTALNKLRREA